MPRTTPRTTRTAKVRPLADVVAQNVRRNPGPWTIGARLTKRPKPNGFVIYEGPSRINPKVAIVVIATGFRTGTANGKTGAMIQTWIIVRTTNPIEALALGLDAAICGGCDHRPQVLYVDKKGRPKYAKRTCYVDIRPVLTIYKAFLDGAYPRLTSSQLADAFAGRKVRLGSYGDPAAVPLAIWQLVTSKAEMHTGYTHQWKSERLRDVTALCQASVDTPEQAAAAWTLGLPTFRVKTANEPLLPGEFACPASAEAGKRTTCAECGACDGSKNRAAINAHGIGAASFAPKGTKPGRTLAVLAA
jgi:hypothetical protein